MQKRSLWSSSACLVVLCLLTMSATSGSSLPQQSCVMHQGLIPETTLYVGGAGPGNYSTIQDAIDDASPGDTVFVYPGLYLEMISIRITLTVRGENRSDTVIDGGGLGTVVSISANNVVLQGFTIQHSRKGISSAGVDISVASNVLVTDSIIRDNEALGIAVRGPGTTHITISESTMLNNTYGVFLQDASQVNITRNTLQRNGEGAYLVRISDSAVTANVMAVNTGLGLHLEDSFGMTIVGNALFENKNGMYLFTAEACNVTDNTVNRNRWYGIWLMDSTSNTIQHNHVSNNVDLGIYLDTSEDNMILSNIVTDNDNGFYLKDSTGNVISNNYVRSDKYNANFVTHRLVHFRNTWRSNYWERPRIAPYPILGYFKINTTHYTLFAFDWTPLRQYPNDSLKAPGCYDGTIWYVGGNGPNNFSSIQEAINHASANDTVYVFQGTYHEAFTVDKPLRIIGENRTTTVLDGDGIKDLVVIVADYVSISGFTVQNSHFDILVNHSSYGTIRDNDILGGLHGVSVRNGCRFLTITGNTVQDNVYGIRLYESTEVTVSHNVFSNNFKENAFFYSTTLASSRNHWVNNYWESPRHLPYAIHGRIRSGSFSFLWVNLDWTPLQTPPF